MLRNYQPLAEEIHRDCVEAGWWKPWPNKFGRYETAMALVISELAEALEGHRKDLNDTHLPQFKMFDVELADTAIRLLDGAGAWNIDVHSADHDYARIAKELVDRTIPEQLYYTMQQATISAATLSIPYTMLCIRIIAKFSNVHLDEIITIKRAYNAQREDHKEENRVKAGGKKI